VESPPFLLSLSRKRDGTPHGHLPLLNRLHTDELEDRYGPISVLVLRHDERSREAHLTDALGVSRTFAVTLFPYDGPPESLREIDADVRAGSPIGKTFREHGYELRNNVLGFEIVELPPSLRAAFHDQHSYAQARLSEMLCRHGRNLPLFYGTVFEIYHPDFRCPEAHRGDGLQEAVTLASLASQGVSLEEAWHCIGSGSSDDERWLRARQAAQSQILLMKERVRGILKATR